MRQLISDSGDSGNAGFQTVVDGGARQGSFAVCGVQKCQDQ